MRTKKLLNVIFTLCMFMMLLTSTSIAATHTVPDDFPTIQAAINFASSGDTVYVRAGTYYEHVTIDRSLTLQGEDRNTTIIDAGGSGKAIYITVNYVTVSGLTATNGDYGIYLVPDWSINHIVISDCILTLNEDKGIYGGHVGGYITIEDCEVSKNKGYAIYSHQFRNSVIKNCKVFENTAGHTILLGWCNNSSIVNCDIYLNNGNGICLDSTRDFIVEGCNIWDNGGLGIYVYRWGYGYNNTVRNNVVAHNGRGIQLQGGHNAYNNLIYHNDIISNGVQAYDYDPRNRWDNGYPSGGNYWSDYDGVDLNNDGIGDTPYEIYDSSGVLRNHDRYPLIRPLWYSIQVFIDIKPGSCPNPVNPKSKGVLPVAILGTEDFDVTDTNPETIILTREGYEDIGVSPIRWAYEDVATPFEGELCECHDMNGDGYLDLTLKFDTQELVATLSLGEVVGDTIPLILTGNLKEEAGGTSIKGSDCIKVLKTGKK